MSIDSYYIGLTNPLSTKWRVNFDEFVQRLLSDWTGVQTHIKPSYDGTKGIICLIPTEEGDVTCWIIQNHPGIFFFAQSTMKAYLKVALWYRQVIPSQYKLGFGYEGSDHYLELQNNTNVDQLSNFAEWTGIWNGDNNSLKHD